MFGRRGQGISINVIIIAAIALVIMVILVALVFRTGGDVTEGTSCNALGSAAACIPEWEYQDFGCGEGYTYNPLRECTESTADDPYVCCIQI